jgi:flagellar protein FlaF
MSKDNNIPNKANPYAAAAGAYDSNTQAHTPDQRELEALVLQKATRVFQNLQDNWDDVTQENLDDALSYNRQIWMMFVDTAIEDTDPSRPIELRNNIASLGLFIFNHTLDVLADPKPEKLDILMDINRDIAAGLMDSKKNDEEKLKSQNSDSAENSPAPSESATV